MSVSHRKYFNSFGDVQESKIKQKAGEIRKAKGLSASYLSVRLKSYTGLHNKDLPFSRSEE
jgi:hypothetical protein